MRVSLSLIVLLALTGGVSHSFAQSASLTKFDSYGRLPTDDEAAHLDFFYNQLRDHANLRGYLIGYNQPSIAPGVFLRRLHGDKRYLVEMRGLPPDRVTVIDGGYRPTFTLELWTLSNDGSAPTLTPTLSRPTLPKRELFDQECLECDAAVILDLYGLSDGLKFYADALRQHPNARGLIIVRPGQTVSTRGAMNRALNAKRLLVRAHSIDQRSLTIRIARRRKDNLSTAEMWIVN